jgi:hypothetical protein
MPTHISYIIGAELPGPMPVEALKHRTSVLALGVGVGVELPLPPGARVVGLGRVFYLYLCPKTKDLSGNFESVGCRMSDGLR